ncbi:MAG: nucleotidyltransferase family protein [Nitrospira sp.]|nr:nucleotidyltransferase family protein [Nitrospira sp.]
MNSLFLQLISPLPFLSPVKITKNDLNEIREQAMRHNLFQLIYSQLQKHQMFIFPQNLVNDFLKESKGLYLKGITLSAKQEAVEKEVVSLLRAKGIQSVLIRGNSLAKELYNDPNCRTSTDIDILIRESDVLSADSVLKENRYDRNDRIPLTFWLHRLHHAIYHYPGTKDIIELHWNFGIPYFFKLSSEDIWDEVTVTDSEQLRLKPEMLIIMLLIHHHMHSFRELKILTDIIWSLHKYKNIIDWHVFALKIRQIGLIKITRITINQIQMVWKEALEDISPIRDLQNEMKEMGYREPKALMSLFRLDFESQYSFQNYRDKLISRFALDNLSTIIISFLKILLPFPQAVKDFYEDKRNWALPFNYLRFIKWRVKEWTNKGNML